MAFGTRLAGFAGAAGLALSLSLSGCGGGTAPEKEAAVTDPSAEAATVNGQTVYVSDVQLEARVKGLVDQNESLEVDSAEFNEILDELIERKLLAIEAVSRGLDEEPVARHRLATARDAILGNILMEQVFDEKVDEAAIRKMYDTQVSLLQLGDEAHVRHVLANSKEDIDKIAAELKGGADFAVVASKRSTDEATRMDGGDLGYIAADKATPEFARLIKELPNGGLSKPFEDQEGWHIVKIEDRRKQQPPSIEELRDLIVRQLRRMQLEEVMKQLRGEAEIKKMTSPRNSKLDVPDAPETKPVPAPATAAPPGGFAASAPAAPVTEQHGAPPVTGTKPPAASPAPAVTTPKATPPAAATTKPAAPASAPPPAPKPATTTPPPAGPVSESRPGSSPQ